MPDVEQKFSALESSIRANCSNPDNAELQARLKDMLESRRQPRAHGRGLRMFHRTPSRPRA